MGHFAIDTPSVAAPSGRAETRSLALLFINTCTRYLLGLGGGRVGIMFDEEKPHNRMGVTCELHENTVLADVLTL